MRLQLFYLLLIVFIAGWIYFFKPYDFPVKKEGGAAIRFVNFLFRQLDPAGLRLELKGAQGIYDDKKIYIKKLQMAQRERNERLMAEYGIYQEDLLKLIGDVEYHGRDIDFYANKALYFAKESLLEVPVSFHLEAKDLVVDGSRLFYYKKRGKIVAYDIEAKATIR